MADRKCASMLKAYIVCERRPHRWAPYIASLAVVQLGPLTEEALLAQSRHWRSTSLLRCEVRPLRQGWSAGITARWSAAVTGAITASIGQASLCASASGRPQAQLGSAGDAQLIGRQPGCRLDWYWLRRGLERCGAWRGVAASHHQLSHPVWPLVARARAARTRRRAHSGWLHRCPCALQDLILTAAQLGSLAAAGLNLRAAGDAVDLDVGLVAGQADSARLPRAAGAR